MTYAFRFDASSCTGCKACQTACKDKNNLPVGVLWRRVYEISGGTWTHTGNSWENTVFSYNLTISCNHCVHPKCAGVCPVNAYSIREDGIVHLDSSKCIGCGYCAWACPYDAPQYDPLSGTMMKCDFCSDDLAAGRPPACVAACPLRVLNVIEADNELVTESGVIPLWISPPTEHPYPLPVYSHTEPHLSIKLHPSMHVTDNKFLANKEEVNPGEYSTWKEFPLIVFTLLTQMAVGGFWFMISIIAPLRHDYSSTACFTIALPSFLIGISLCLGLLVSFFHLGNKRNSWRVFFHLRKSWLSREILFTILFGIGWFSTTLAWINKGGLRHPIPSALALPTALFGFGLVMSMAQVYRLPTVLVWNTWRTKASFLITTFLLGFLGLTCIFTLASHSAGTGIPQIPSKVFSFGALLLLAQLVITIKFPSPCTTAYIRLGLILAGLFYSLALLFDPTPPRFLLTLFLFIIVLIEEILGRWLFYKSREQYNLTRF